MNIAIVTGASSGLGREFILELDKQPEFDEIWGIARRRERLEELTSMIKTPMRILTLDLTDPESFQEITRLLERRNPVIRLLINAAGFGKIGSYKDISAEDCSRMIDLNCKAAVEMTQLSLPYMKKGSRIMEICSTAAFQPLQYLNVYAASKSFLYRYSRALGAELSGTGIRVTAVCPYWIRDTEFIKKAQKTKDSRYIRGFPFASRRKNVVKTALADSRLGIPVSTPGPVCYIHRIGAWLIPDSLLMAIWELLRKL
ncbi:MAG: SDR family NAD(P)-dependent oxidoreductase [Clostridiales bacterium]|nr:SDR family NAD(P)-dependent oxidoreductase [Clostridiales bacterium]